jgi:penicillin-binding protein 2
MSAQRPFASRRFLPPDPRVEEPYLLTPQLALRVAILGFVALTLIAVLFLRLWALQVLSGDKYRTQASENQARTRPLEAPRGSIVDRHGRVLVRNVQGTSLTLSPSDLPKNRAKRMEVLRRLSVVVGMSEQRILDLLKAHAQDPATPVVLRRGLHDDQIQYLAEHKALFPGVEREDTFLRKYPFHSLAAHMLGHVAEISEDELKAMKKDGYKLGDVIGQAGVEATYDKYLRGTDGEEQRVVDSRGRPTGPQQVTKTFVPGNTLRLTLDLNLQRAAEQAIRTGIQAAHSAEGGWAANGGAIVALDPRNGAVLALASYPTFEPSIYVSRDPKKLARVQNDAVARKDNYPGLNRALDVTYPPGSTWKPVTALAAMQEHVIEPYTSLLCSPTFTAYGQEFHNWTPYLNHWIELPTALAESCDTYFYRVGLDFYELPSSRGHLLQQWASRFGFGAPTGVDVGPEASGLVPTPEWRQKQFAGPQYGEIDRTWKPGYSVQLAIGQGDLTVTPIQMARFYAMIANGGRLVTPHVAEDVEEPTGDPTSSHVLRRFDPPPAESPGVDPAALNVVREGLFEATHAANGTSSGIFGSFPEQIAGKTGTAEKLITLPGESRALKLNQSWWCGYGPVENPTITVCAVIDNGGHGGSAAAPAALKVFEKWFKVPDVTTTDHASD